MKRGISPSSSIISLFRVHPMLSQLFPLPAATHSEHHAQCRKYNVDEHGRGLPVLPASNVAVFSMNAHCVQSGLQYAVVDLLYTLFAVFTAPFSKHWGYVQCMPAYTLPTFLGSIVSYFYDVKTTFSLFYESHNRATYLTIKEYIFQDI